MTKQKGQSKFIVYLFAFISLTCWGISYIWTDRLVNLDIPVFYFVPMRSFIAGIILLLVSVCTGNFQKLEKRDVPRFMLLALLQPLIYFLAESYGIKETGSPTVSSMLIAASPILSIIAGVVVFSEKVSKINIGGIIVTLCGICLVVFSKEGELGPRYLLGILLLVVAVSSEAGHATVTKSLAMTYSPLNVVMYQFIFGSVYLLPFFCTLGVKGFEMRWVTSIEVWIPILCLGALCSSLAFALWANAIKHLGVAKAGMITALIPVVSAIASLLIGREVLLARQWIGIAIAVVGIIFTQHTKRKIP